MAGLEKTVEQSKKKSYVQGAFDPEKFDTNLANPLVPVTDTVSNVSGAFTPDIPEPDEMPIIPIPDEQTAAAEARKRRAKAVGTGRQSTILTEGLGG